MTEPTLQERLRRRNRVTEPECHEAADALDKAEQRIKELEQERDAIEQLVVSES